MKYEVGTTIDGRYRLEAFLGSGASGTVFRALEIQLNRTVAIKILKLAQNGLSDHRQALRFEREAKALSELLHPGIVRVFKFGIDDSTPFLVMEYLEGETLRDLLERRVQLPCHEAIVIAKQIAAALEYAHSAGIVHRDLKPENIFVDTNQESFAAKILDFGLCKRTEKEADLTLTGTGHLLGTALYMSPEQCLGKPASPCSDIYSFACVLFEMITGQAPFNGTSPEILLKHLSEPMPKLLEMAPGCGMPIELQYFLLKCTEKSQDQRFQSFSELQSALSEIEALNCRKTFDRSCIGRKQISLPALAKLLPRIPKRVALLTAFFICTSLIAASSYLFFTQQGNALLVKETQRNLSTDDAIAALTQLVKQQIKLGKVKEAEKTMFESCDSFQFRKWPSLSREILIENYIDLCKSEKMYTQEFELKLRLLGELLEDVQRSVHKKELPDKHAAENLDSLCRELLDAKLSTDNWIQLSRVVDTKWSIGGYESKSEQTWWWLLKATVQRRKIKEESIESRTLGRIYGMIVSLAIQRDDPELVERTSKESFAYLRNFDEYVRSSDIHVSLGNYYLRKHRIEDARKELIAAKRDAAGHDLSAGETEQLTDLETGCRLGHSYQSPTRDGKKEMNPVYRAVLNQRSP